MTGIRMGLYFFAVLFCVLIAGCKPPEKPQPAAAEEKEPESTTVAVPEAEVEIAEVQIGDSYETVLDKLGTPKGTIKAGETTQCLLFPLATITLTDNAVSRIEHKNPAASTSTVPAGRLEDDPVRRERLIEMIKARLDKELRRYDKLCAEEKQLKSRLRDIDPQARHAREYADYYETKYASSKQYRLDWQYWRRRYNVDYDHRASSRLREDTYKRISDKYRDEQIGLENEAYDTVERLKMIEVEKVKIEEFTRPDLETIDKLRAM